VILYSCNIRCSSLTADLQIQQARFPVDLEIFDERKLGVLKTGVLSYLVKTSCPMPNFYPISPTLPHLL
jgi:hypothetical protein